MSTQLKYVEVTAEVNIAFSYSIVFSTVLNEQKFRPVCGSGTQGWLLGRPSPSDVIQNLCREMNVRGFS